MMNITQIEQQAIAKRLTNLSANKRLELIKLLRKEGIEPLKLPIVPAIRESNKLPLSWGQERLWLFNQIQGASATYNESTVVRITGNLDINALQRALSEITRRHEVLRTSFQSENGTPIQVIHQEVTININVVDLQKYSEQERQTLVKELTTKIAITPFDLGIAPLVRCNLLHVSPVEHLFLLTIHHIIADVWSMGILIQELSSLYQAFTQGFASPLAELPIQYADFAIWQRQWLSGDKKETQLNYWKQQLQGAPELLQLPTDRPRPIVQTYRGRITNFTLNTDLTQNLQTLSRESDTTLFMTMYAAFATLLYRYSGQSDISIGSPIANRNRSEIEPLIGFFLNTLVLRSRFEDNPSFKQLLAQVKETTLKAYEHQDVPFEQVVEALRPKRSLSYSPLYQAWFVLQNISMPPLKLPGVTITPLNSNAEISKCDLLLSMRKTEKGLESFWQYNTDLFDDTTIVRMTEHLQNLLEGILANPQAKVRELPLLKKSEKQQLSKKSLGKLKQIKRNSIKLEKSQLEQ